MSGRTAVRALATEPFDAPAIAVARPHLPTALALSPYLQRIDEARWYSNFGPLLMELEERLAHRFLRDTHVVTGVNATQVLGLTLAALDLPAGSLCALPAWTFVATAHAVIQAGLSPYFVDVDPSSWMLDPDTVARAVRGAPGPVSAVVPVSAFGALPDLERWRTFREAMGLPVVIDAAAAFDAARDARLPVVVSLHATKVLGIGEGGYLASEDAGLVERVRQSTTYGFQRGRESLRSGTNAKLSEYAAAVGHAALDAWPLERLRWRRAAQLLRMAFTGLPEVTFQPGWGEDWLTSVCTVRLPDTLADAAEAALESAGVGTRRWWGQGCHTSPAFAASPRTELPHTDRLARSTLGLPFAVDLDADACGRIAAALQPVLARQARPAAASA